MKVVTRKDKRELGQKAAEAGAAAIREAIRARGSSNVVVATGASQFEMIDVLVTARAIDWSKVSFFHLDEYVALPITHPASFRKFLRERLFTRQSVMFATRSPSASVALMT